MTVAVTVSRSATYLSDQNQYTRHEREAVVPHRGDVEVYRGGGALSVHRMRRLVRQIVVIGRALHRSKVADEPAQFDFFGDVGEVKR